MCFHTTPNQPDYPTKRSRVRWKWTKQLRCESTLNSCLVPSKSITIFNQNQNKRKCEWLPVGLCQITKTRTANSLIHVWQMGSCTLYLYACELCMLVRPLTTGCSCVPGIMALASCICWASMAMFFCWMRLFLPLISSWVFRWGGGCRYLQFSLEQRPWWGEREKEVGGDKEGKREKREG